MINRRSFMASSLALTFALPTGTALAAGDDGLYDDVFDPQSSFVRVFAQDGALAAIEGTRITDFNSGLSEYVNVMPGTVQLIHSGGTANLTVAPRTHYSVVLQINAEPLVLVDDLQLNPAKSDVSLYNMSAHGAVDLFVPAARAWALRAVPVAGSKSVALRAPLTLDFDLRSGEQTIASITSVELKRRAGVSIVLSGSEGQFAAVAVPNTYKR